MNTRRILAHTCKETAAPNPGRLPMEMRAEGFNMSILRDANDYLWNEFQGSVRLRCASLQRFFWIYLVLELQKMCRNVHLALLVCLY